MENAIQSVIDIDKQARLRAREIRSFRESCNEKLEQDKKELSVQLSANTEKILAENAEKKAQMLSHSQQQLEQQQQISMQYLQQQVNENREKWVHNIVQAIIG